MTTEEMRRRWAECKDSYEAAPFMVRSQLKPFMAPMLALLWELISAADGLKVQSFNSGACDTCTGLGPRCLQCGQDPSTQAVALAQPLTLGGPQHSAAQGFPPIEG